MNSVRKLVAKPQSTVIRLHIVSEMMMINIRLLRSARRAIGIPSVV